MAKPGRHSAGVSTDGRLIATSFNLSVCDHCDSAHFDLLDPEGRTFSTATIAPEDFRKVAAWFTQAAIDFEASTGKALDA
ncbi:hypothetical protein ACVILK_000655 [Bradyrhizobium embrapense]